MLVDVVFAADVSDYYREKLEFDKQGNLLMTTHDKKATSKVTYRTLGWIIKRYDAPIDTPGQQYAVIRLKNYTDIWYRDDPDDNTYVYCYYYGDKDEIYSAIGKASKEWQNQLYKYGDSVYIDEVMTVCTGGVNMGSLTGNSSNSLKSSGEIYVDYKGISTARPWASKESLLTHFNKKVLFPSTIEPPEYSVSESIVDTQSYYNTPVLVTKIGHNRPGAATYDVSKGIPVNEKLYVQANADKAMYDMEFNRYLGNAYYPVKVNVTYRLRWTDTNGRSKSETVTVAYWYRIKRPFSYWVLNRLSYYGLTKAQVTNGVFPGGRTDIMSGYVPKITSKHKTGYRNHVQLSSYTSSVSVNGGTITSSNKLRPSIPDRDYSADAEKAVGKFNVYNDELIIDGNTILSSSKVSVRGSNPKAYSTTKLSMITSGLTISTAKRNGMYESVSKAVYTRYDKASVNYEVSGNFYDHVIVHTPVICEAMIKTDTQCSQEVGSQNLKNCVVIGKAFSVDISATGTHAQIPGYRYGNYSKYVGQKWVMFPFCVYSNKKLYSENTWIPISTDTTFTVPVGTAVGDYTVTCMDSAVNKPKDIDAQLSMQEHGNLYYDYYGAYSEFEMHVSGRLYGYTLDNGAKYTVGNRNEDGKLNGSENIMPAPFENRKIPFAVISVGDYAYGDSTLQIDLDYQYLVGKTRVAVDVYRRNRGSCDRISDKLELDYEQLQAIGDSASIKVKDKEAARQGMQRWNGELDFSGTLVYVPRGKYGDVEEYATIKNDIITGGNLVVNGDIYIARWGERELTYMKGKCNMWKTEGFDYKNIFLDGDFLVSNMRENSKNDYNVVGTH